MLYILEVSFLYLYISESLHSVQIIVVIVVVELFKLLQVHSVQTSCSVQL